MTATWSSPFNCPCIFPQGDLDPNRMMDFADEKGAWLLSGNGKRLYVIEFDITMGPQLWSRGDLIAEAWKGLHK